MAAEAGRIPILLYHGIAAGAPAAGASGRFTVTRDDFRRQMDELAAGGRQTHTISDLAARLRRPHADHGPPPAAVTFDDGTADFYDLAWPVLRERGLQVTLYVISGAVGGAYGGARMLSWEQLAELRDAGVEIGAHGLRHVALDLVPLDRAAIEIVDSRLLLQDRLQAGVETFAYPFGYHTPAVKRLVARAGYTSACAVKNALSHSDDDHFALARLTVTRDMTLDRIAGLVRGAGAPESWAGERVRTRAWRAYRRGRALWSGRTLTRRPTPAGRS